MIDRFQLSVVNAVLFQQMKQVGEDEFLDDLTFQKASFLNFTQVLKSVENSANFFVDQTHFPSREFIDQNFVTIIPENFLVLILLLQIIELDMFRVSFFFDLKCSLFARFFVRQASFVSV